MFITFTLTAQYLHFHENIFNSLVQYIINTAHALHCTTRTLDYDANNCSGSSGVRRRIIKETVARDDVECKQSKFRVDVEFVELHLLLGTLDGTLKSVFILGW